MLTQALKPTLYIVATPIGNLNDITLRAIDTLKQVEFIAAEDTRHTRRLLSQFEIETSVISFHDYSSEESARKLLERIVNGENCALVSDAGTPLISDPGYRLVSLAPEYGVTVSPIPGACALIAGLSAAGLPSDRFCFEGFLPAKPLQRQKRLASLAGEERTLVFYEAPHRIEALLADMKMEFGEQREVVLGRELTKTFETITRGTLAELVDFTAADANQRRGEFVVMVAGEQAVKLFDDKVKETFALLNEELPPKKAAKIAAQIHGVNAKDIYQWSLTKNS
ncbi:16S rRNA (cytidine(1402)-2'-O)-methyltransferase [Umboniibacter marinipuniceus]|uniref:16S rRNA (cytidine(1402)-2'-O)-methyltransferase n=1 Tax=Umboniibacter marinipuniceus TaxID=569599 RepID=UPI000EF8C5D7